MNRVRRASAPEGFAQALDRGVTALGGHGVCLVGHLIEGDACACHIVYPLLYCVYDTVHYTEYTTIHKQYAKHLHIVTNKAQKSPLGGGQGGSACGALSFRARRGPSWGAGLVPRGQRPGGATASAGAAPGGLGTGSTGLDMGPRPIPRQNALQRVFNPHPTPPLNRPRKGPLRPAWSAWGAGAQRREGGEAHLINPTAVAPPRPLAAWHGLGTPARPPARPERQRRRPAHPRASLASPWGTVGASCLSPPAAGREGD